MKTVVGACTVAPVHSAEFSPRSYRPKRKMPGPNNKRKSAPSSFSTILSALIIDKDRTR